MIVNQRDQLARCRGGTVGSRPVLLASFSSRFLMAGSMGTLAFVEDQCSAV